MLRRAVSAYSARAAMMGAGAAAASVPAVAECRDDKSKTLTSSFDPEALERGAKALREINSSVHAKKVRAGSPSVPPRSIPPRSRRPASRRVSPAQPRGSRAPRAEFADPRARARVPSPLPQVIDLSNAQEVTKQQEAMAKTAEMQAATAQHQLAAERERGEQNRKTDQARAQQHAQMKQYEDELARKRYASEHEQTRQRNAEMVRMQEEASARQESLRRQTEESIQQSRRETDRQKAEHERELIRAKSIAEAEGRIAENRANEDVIRRQMLARVEAETTKAMALLKETVSAFGAGFNGLLADKQRGTALVAGLTALAAGVYGAREGSRMGFRALERYLGQPSLVRETSRNVYGFRPAAAAAAAPPAPSAAGGVPKSNILGDVVLEKSLETRVSQLAIATANTRKNSAPFRNVMLYGPPGTGKTMAAKRLARHSGLDYALMTGVTSHPSAPMPSPASTSCSIGRPRRDAVSSSSSTRRMRFGEGAEGPSPRRRGRRAFAPRSTRSCTARANSPATSSSSSPRTDRRISTPRCSIAWTRRWNSRCLTRTRARGWRACISTNSSFAARMRETTRPRRVSSGRSASERGDAAAAGRPGRPSSSIPRLTTRRCARWRSARRVSADAKSRR